MLKIIKSVFFVGAAGLLLVAVGCKKGTFDINSPNPNLPSSVSPKFVLSAALQNTSLLMQGGDEDFANLYMGYWAVSGDYIPTSTTLTYNTSTTYYSDNWNTGYITLKNFQQIIDLAGTKPENQYFVAIAKIMQAFNYGRLIDMYNNLPYTDALKAGTQNFPKYDDASSVYPSLVNQLDTAVILINTAAAGATTTPGNYDIMFKASSDADMQMWVKFANTVKLKLLMNLTQTSGGSGAITSGLAGLTQADFLGAGEDATINPGYTNAVTPQQSPFWQDMGFAPSGAVQGNNSYYRACSYAVNFYKATNDTVRMKQIYALNSNGEVQGRTFGSVGANEHNTVISAMGPGILSDPGMNAVILGAYESLFLQAEAIQRGYLAGDAASTYQSAVEESFRILGDANYTADAATLTAQSNPKVNFAAAPDKNNLIVLQAWAALNAYDPVEAWSNWRRLGIPSDLPVSIYPGTTATHVPYRMLYPDTEYSYNADNVNSQGTINNLTSKIFWQP
jgi:hypothetical protein